MISQLSVFVENKEGRLAAVLRALRDAKVDIEALSLADTAEFGVLRMIVDRNDAAIAALTAIGVVVQETPVIGLYIPNRPGGLSLVTDLLQANGISIKYIYAFLGQREGIAKVALRVEEQERTVQLLRDAGFELAE